MKRVEMSWNEHRVDSSFEKHAKCIEIPALDIILIIW